MSMLPTWPLCRSLTLPAAAAGIMLSAGPAASQPEVAISASARLEHSNHATEPDDTGGAPAMSAELAHGWSDDGTRIFYRLDTGTFATPGEWLYQAHQAGVVHRIAVRGEDRRVYLGATATVRANGDSWADAGYRGVSAFSNLEALMGAATFRTGYRFDWREFPDYAELTQDEHTGFGSLLLNLPTRTTLIGEIVLGAKRYGSLPSTDPLTTNTGEAPVVQLGRGAGRGMGPAFRPSVSPAVIASPGSTVDDTSASGLVTVFGRVAQSIADRTALSVDLSRRETFGGLAPVVVATPELFFDDGVYDDPFASDAMTWRAGFKHVFAGGATLEGGLTRAWRDYTSTPALGQDGAALPGSPLREDRAWRADAQLTFPLRPSHTGRWEIEAVGSVLHVNQQSNDAYYDYRSMRFGLGLAVSH